MIRISCCAKVTTFDLRPFLINRIYSEFQKCKDDYALECIKVMKLGKDESNFLLTNEANSRLYTKKGTKLTNYFT